MNIPRRPGSEPDSPARLPDPMRPALTGAHSSDTLGGGLIPNKNPHARWSYYLGLFSLFPVLGFPMGVVAVLQGIKGLKLVKAEPRVHGKTHAMVGLITGILFGGFNLLMVLLLAAAFLMHDKQR